MTIEWTWQSAALGYFKVIAAFFLAEFWWGVSSAGKDAIWTLSVLMFFDYATGLAAARMEGTISSQRGLTGLRKKGFTLAFILLLHFLESRVNLEANLELVGSMCYAFNEFVSILENLNRMGVPIDERVVEFAKRFRMFKVKEATAEDIKSLKDGE